MKFLFRTPGLPLVLIPSLVLSPIWAQAPLSAPNQASLGTNLELRVIESGTPQSPGNFAPAKRLAVQVRDGNGAPVADAAVAFRLPDAPLSGNFADGSHSAVAYTDQSGVAHVDGIQWIASSGSVPVRITATKGNSHAGLLFEEKMSATSEAATVTPSVDAGLKQAPLPNAPVPSTPGVVTSDSAKVQSAAISADLEAAPPAPRPSVSVSNFSRSSSVRANSLRPDAEPSVSISSSPGGYSNHSNLKKWLIWTAVAAAGAGAAFAFSGKGGSSSSTTSSSTTTIGTPTINIGH